MVPGASTLLARRARPPLSRDELLELVAVADPRQLAAAPDASVLLAVLELIGRSRGCSTGRRAERGTTWHLPDTNHHRCWNEGALLLGQHAGRATCA